MAPLHAITIGNFDGVHLGHRALIAAARQAVGDDGRVTVLAFERHPLTTLRPVDAPSPLTTFGQRARFLRELGADEVVPLTADADFLGLSADEFLDHVVAEHHPTHVVEGHDFRFGRDRGGDTKRLQARGSELAYQTILVAPVNAVLFDHTSIKASSSLARWMLKRGRVGDVRAILGRPYEMEAVVVEGHRHGREIGYPTANLAPGACLLPADGVYAGTALLQDGQSVPAAISVGTNPTFQGDIRVCEAHLVGHEAPYDHYGWTIRLMFDAWLRAQITYTSVDLLTDQLHRDVARTRTMSGLSKVGAA